MAARIRMGQDWWQPPAPGCSRTVARRLTPIPRTTQARCSGATRAWTTKLCSALKMLCQSSLIEQLVYSLAELWNKSIMSRNGSVYLSDACHGAWIWQRMLRLLKFASFACDLPSATSLFYMSISSNTNRPVYIHGSFIPECESCMQSLWRSV